MAEIHKEVTSMQEQLTQLQQEKHQLRDMVNAMEKTFDDQVRHSNLDSVLQGMCSFKPVALAPYDYNLTIFFLTSVFLYSYAQIVWTLVTLQRMLSNLNMGIAWKSQKIAA